MIYFSRVLSFLVAISLQFFLADEFAIGGVIPNLITGFIIFWNLSENYYLNMSSSFIAGLAFDVLYPQLFGVGTLAFTIIAFLVYMLHNSISKNRALVVFLSVLFLNFIFFLLYNTTSKAFWVNGEVTLMYLFGFIYNTVISFIGVYFLYFFSIMKISFDEVH